MQVLMQKELLELSYGLPENIYCITSINGGQTFSRPILVGNVAKMHLGIVKK